MTSSPYPEYNTAEPPQDDDEFSIFDYLAIVLDEWRVIAVTLILTLIITALYLLFSVPIYVASGALQVSTDDNTSASAILELTGVGKPSPTETEVEILKSRYILSLAASRVGLNLNQAIPSLMVNFNVTLFGQSPVSRELQALRGAIAHLAVADWHESPVQAVFEITTDGVLLFKQQEKKEARLASGETYNDGGIRFRYLGPGKLRPKVSIPVDLIPDDWLVNELSDRFSVGTVGGRKETNLVRISFSHPDRLVAAEFVNAIMDTYLDFALNWRTRQAEKSSEFIEGQLDGIRISLEKNESEVQAFLEASGAVLLPDQAKELIRVSADMELEMRKVRIQENVMSQVSSAMKRSDKKGDPIALSGDFLFGDELLSQAVSVLNELQIKRQTLLADLTPSHPDIRRIEEEERRVKNQISEYMKSSKQRIEDTRKGLNSALEQIQEKLATFPDKERNLAMLRRNQEVNQELYTFLMTKLEESRILKASATTDKRIIDSASTPYKKDQPRRMNTMFVSLLIGLLLGVGFVFLKRTIDPHVRDEEEAKKQTGLPVHGVIPNLGALGLAQPNSPAVEQIWKAPKGPAAESFRTLRTNIEFSQTPETPIKVIQITSSEAAEGKSTVISNLAVSLSKAGHRVIVADLDLRRPTQHKIWAIPKSPGISDHLAGHQALTVHTLEHWEVDVVSAGHEPPESQRLLSSAKLAGAIAGWREKYDYILLDTPPLLVADSLVISRLSDMLLFIVRPGNCRRASLKLAGLSQRKMTLIKGLVINGSASRRGGYYHYYRGSYYGSKTTDTQES